MATVALSGLVKHFGATSAVNEFSLDVADGEFVALLGPSGCGKTTTLRMIAGFVEPTSGTIAIDGRDVTQLPPYRRNTGMVFQGYALFPHMTVAQNVAFGLQMRNVGADDATARVRDTLAMVRLQSLESRFPSQLSGGQQQRVALARALVINPAVLLLDEPLSNLDAKLRGEMRIEIRQLQRRLALTTIFVTHDQEEALTMADRLVVMDRGAVQQIGTPWDLYERPDNRFVADFIGKSNIFAGRLAEDGIFRTAGGISIAVPRGTKISGEAVVGVRPERMRITTENDGLPNAFPGTIEFVTYFGTRIEVLIALESGEKVLVHAPVDTVAPDVGARRFVTWTPENSLLLRAEEA
jgi:putative spermidine/putrescine transport system ATP-binding protein